MTTAPRSVLLVAHTSRRQIVRLAERAAEGCELVLVLGGDGTFLRAAELARPAGVPMLGVNLGHVGFLAETDPQGLDDAVDAVVNGRYGVEERVTVGAEIVVDGVVTDIGLVGAGRRTQSAAGTVRKRGILLVVAPR